MQRSAGGAVVSARECDRRSNGAWRRLLAAAAGLTVSLGIGNAQGAQNGNPNPGVMPPQANAFGNSYEEWSALWWQWAVSLPSDMHPLNDTADCSAGQSGNVWFLGGQFDSFEVDNETHAVADRDCTIPSGTALFFPILNVACDVSEFDPQLCELIVDHATDMQVSIEHDGITTEIQDLDDYRIEPFAFTVDPYVDAPGNILDLPGPTAYVGEGVYLMLAPLAVGTYTLHFEGAFVFSTEAGDDFDSVFELDITYEMNVVPKGQYQAP